MLRIEDHDRQRCRPEYEAALLADLEALAFRPDEPAIASLRGGGVSAYRQSDNGATYATAVALLERVAPVYACDCSRATFATWAAAHGRTWSGPGCPGGCISRGLARDAADVAWRVALGHGDEPWTDLVLGPQAGPVTDHGGDLAIRDRHGNWAYALCVIVDDLRHEIGLVIRGEDLLDATPAQIRLAHLLGRREPPLFLHHPLVRRPDGRKLSKADGATAVGERLAAGVTPATLLAEAAAAIGLAELEQATR